ncbi:hypothetical protein CI109_102541 [Kwoniella shandongensis]|uniref:Uncharacterized protein n=1 Tax=Kwoniella shandongensis TaxID=1734106 RepID=A0A5M6BUE2_9TREE|nr:uncharacterized protein CI109_005844 [Kwoniella shandongensis]KAA5525821.1 hypothetical protein CI109_005844 [Kwoniella shandongensis]
MASPDNNAYAGFTRYPIDSSPGSTTSGSQSSPRHPHTPGQSSRIHGSMLPPAHRSGSGSQRSPANSQVPSQQYGSTSSRGPPSTPGSNGLYSAFRPPSSSDSRADSSSFAGTSASSHRDSEWEHSDASTELGTAHSRGRQVRGRAPRQDREESIPNRVLRPRFRNRNEGRVLAGSESGRSNTSAAIAHRLSPGSSDWGKGSSGSGYAAGPSVSAPSDRGQSRPSSGVPQPSTPPTGSRLVNPSASVYGSTGNSSGSRVGNVAHNGTIGSSFLNLSPSSGASSHVGTTSSIATAANARPPLTESTRLSNPVIGPGVLGPSAFPHGTMTSGSSSRGRSAGRYDMSNGGFLLSSRSSVASSRSHNGTTASVPTAAHTTANHTSHVEPGGAASHEQARRPSRHVGRGEQSVVSGGVYYDSNSDSESVGLPRHHS